MSQRQQANTMLKPQAAHQYQVPYSAKQHFTMGPAAHYHAPYAQHHQYGAPAPFNSGAQTISRSSNLHKHFAAGSQTMKLPRNYAQNSQQVYTTPASGAPYDQPYLSAGPPMTLAMRAPRERGSIPVGHYGAGGLANTIGHAHSRHYLEQLYALQQQQQQQQQQQVAATNLVAQHARFGTSNKPLCRCRVMYLGSSVPHITKNGLHGIQEPLRHLYPEEKFNTSSLRRKSREASTIDISHLSSSLGIDSWLSVWSNGLLLENVDEFGREIKRFFAIESLHYCAAVRFFDTSALAHQTKPQPPVTVSQNQPIDPNNNTSGGDATDEQENQQPPPSGELDTNPAGALDRAGEQGESQKRGGGVVRFLPLDAPIFTCPGMLDANHPPVFAAIMRRTSGIKVLECHAFICRRDAASNALVRCCTHAYADFLNAKRLSVELGGGPAQLQQKLMASASGSSSYYTGGESSATLARGAGGRDGGPRRQSRSSSVGRASHPSRRASGQYQEVEAIVQQHQQQQPPRHPKSRPAQSLSTGGTNSQEMTHSEENSLEDEANDYAIISRQAHRGSSHGRTTSYQRMRSSRSRRDEGASSTSRRHRERRTKGSSKSLFTDFQPQAQQQQQQVVTPGDRKSRDELDRLSHSLDHLQMAATCCSAAAGTQLTRSDSTAETSGPGEPIKYSIVSGKHKRHSKSMQQLHPPAGPPLGAPPPPPPLPADFDVGGSLGSARHRRRKATSYQDIFAETPASVGGSLSRRSSTSRRHRRSRRLARHSHASSMSSLQDSSLAGRGSQRRHSAADRKCSLELSNVNGGPMSHPSGNYNGIYATCDEVGLAPEPTATGRLSMSNSQPRVLGPDCCVQPAANTLRRQSKSRRHSEKREQLALEQQQQQQQMMAAYCGQVQPPPPLPPHHAHPGYAYSPQPAPLMVPAHPLYSTGGYYVPGAALYDSPYLAASPPVVPGPAAHLYQQFGHPAGPHHSAMFQPATISARHSHQQQQPLMTVGRTPKSSPATGGGGTTKSAKSKSQTLATRFRCLSPPVNFFSSSRACESGQPGECGPQHQADLNNNNNRHSVASAGSSSTTTTSERVSPGQVVSGQPGFLASSANQAAGSSGPGARPGKRSSSKLSWIKRLSLTLSGGGGAGSGPSQIVSSAPSGHADTTMAGASRHQVPPSINDGPTADGQREAGALGENKGRSLLSDQAAGELDSGEPQVVHRDQPTAATSPSEPPDASQAKIKRTKRAGLFSGTLTLGRSAKAKTALQSASASERS